MDRVAPVGVFEKEVLGPGANRGAIQINISTVESPSQGVTITGETMESEDDH